MNGITYYRLKSDYPGDYTKNCALNGIEVDNNFYVLEGRDVKTIAVNGKDLVVTLLNGDTVTASGAMDFVKPEEIQSNIIKVEFDKLNGVLKLTFADGTVHNIEGFATNENTNFSVSTDSTICGDGLRKSPLGVAPAARTGQYKPVKSLINVTEGASLPYCGNLLGDRYVTCEDISDYGYLYDYNAIRDIARELKNTEWRIPTKADWDDLLNAVEPCECDKTHDKADKNKILGKWAGKLLKSKDMWLNNCCNDSCGCNCNCGGCNVDTTCGNNCDCAKDICIDYSDNPCDDTCECVKKRKCGDNCCGDHKGLDAYGFRATPAGYADDGCNYGYFKERGAFWTATTNTDNTKAYIKRFQYNKDGVYQDVIPSNYHLTLRLVKDYDGKNYFDTEEIMDMEYPTLLLPSVSKGKSIWTSCNFACGNASLNPMIPNDGQGLTYTRHYFINEWDGFRWVRNEMKQGDSVVIVQAPKGKQMVEYRVIGDKFVSVNEMIYDDVMTDVKVVIDGVEKKITNRIELVEKSVEIETEDRKSADERLQSSIEALEVKTDKTNEDLATVNTNLVTAVNKINSDIATVNQNLVDAINTINGGIATEIQERKDADTELNEKFSSAIEDLNVKTDKTNEELGKTNKTLTDFGVETNKAIETLNTAISTVNQNLVDAINTINGGIATEIQERKDADEAEKNNRIASEEEIKGTILTSEGTEFDKESGVLTLKSKDATNDITVQLSFNFGEF